MCTMKKFEVKGNKEKSHNRFGHMTEFEEFRVWRTVGKAQWTSEKQIRCADAQWTLDNDSLSCFLKEAQARRVKLRTVGKQTTFGANIFMAREVLFRDVLRIYLSEFGKGQEEPSLGIKV